MEFSIRADFTVHNARKGGRLGPGEAHWSEGPTGDRDAPRCIGSDFDSNSNFSLSPSLVEVRRDTTVKMKYVLVSGGQLTLSPFRGLSKISAGVISGVGKGIIGTV